MSIGKFKVSKLVPSYFIWLGLVFSIVFWFADSLIDTLFFSHHETFLESLSPTGMDLYMRFLVSFQLVVFGYLISHYVKAKNDLTHQVEMRLDKERKHAEEEFTRFGLAVQHCSEVIVLADAFHLIQFVNPAFERLFGYKLGEVQGKPLSILLPDDTKFKSENPIEFGSFQGERLRRTKDGCNIPVLLKVSEFKNEQGQVIGHVGSMTDLSDIKTVMASLRESETFKRVILDSVFDEIVVINQQGVITMTNQAWRNFAMENSPDPGRPPCSDVGVNYLEVCQSDGAISLKGQQTASEGIQSVLDGLAPSFSMEYPCHTLEKERWFCMRVMPLGLAGNGAVIAHTNITEQKLIENALRLSEERLSLALVAGHQGWFDLDLFTGKVTVSPEYARMLGYAPETFHSSLEEWEAGLHPDDREAVLLSLSECIATGGLWTMEYRRKTATGAWIWISSVGEVTEWDDERRSQRMIGTHTDITARKKSEQSIRLSQFSLDHAGEEIYWIDSNARIVDANARACKALGYSKEELIGLSVTDIDNVFIADKWLAHWQELKEKGSLRFESEHRTRDGKNYPVEVLANYFEYEGKEYNCAFTRDITRRKQLEDELKRQARIDFLTGLSNRGHFMEQGELELRRAIRYDNSLSIFMMDVDFFKQVNDSHGHKVGDAVLKKLAEVCHQTMRDVDIVGRVGGEEFAILLPETGIEEAAEVAERLREAIANAKVPLPAGGLPIHFTVSIGVASLSTKDDNMDLLLYLADKALYAAKSSGRNRVCISSE